MNTVDTATQAMGQDQNGDAGPSTGPARTLPKPGTNVPVFIMLPLDTVNADGVFKYAASRWFITALEHLRDSGVHGVAVDVWWAAVERRPRRYDWSGYRLLFDMISALGLKVQVVMAFHACGGNVGDNAEIPLPAWVTAAGDRDPDIYFTDRPRDSTPGQRNRECISLFAAEEPGLLRGRSPMQCYVDFMRAFRDEFSSDLSVLIEEVVVGSGPCGELRFPSYPETNGWRFPGIGEFQCYDRRALASLARAAAAAGRLEWGNAGPHDAGGYNSGPEETGFFQGWGGRWDTDYGRFFLRWYSQALIDHGDRMLAAATSVFNVKKSDSALAAAAKTPSVLAQQEGGGDTPVSMDDNTSSEGGVPGWLPWRQGSGNSGNGGGSLRGGVGGGNVRAVASAGSLDGLAAQQAGSSFFLDAAPAPNSPNSNSSGGQPSSAPGAPLLGQLAGGGPSRPPSYSSFRSSSISEGLNTLEDWTWPSPSGPPVALTLKMSGVHWWYRTRSHAAELTAGYYNVDGNDGYGPIVNLCSRHGASLTLTCVEMCDSQHPPEALCGPEGLLRQVREVAAAAGVEISGENALPCFMPNVIDEVALQRVVYNTQPWGTPLQVQQGAGEPGEGGMFGSTGAVASMPDLAGAGGAGEGEGGGGGKGEAKLPPLRSFTFLRLTPEMMAPSYFAQWGRFMALMAHNAQRFKTSPRWRQNLGFSNQ